jgi:hypothetical protein
MALIDHRDAAEAGLRVLTDPALWGAHHDLTGPALLSWPEALELPSAELGEPVTFRVAAERQFLDRLTGAGIPAGTAELLITREWAILAGENDYTTGTFQRNVSLGGLWDPAPAWGGRGGAASPTSATSPEVQVFSGGSSYRSWWSTAPGSTAASSAGSDRASRRTGAARPACRSRAVSARSRRSSCGCRRSPGPAGYREGRRSPCRRIAARGRPPSLRPGYRSPVRRCRKCSAPGGDRRAARRVVGNPRPRGPSRTATTSGGAEVTHPRHGSGIHPASCRKPAGLAPGTRPAVPG